MRAHNLDDLVRILNLIPYFRNHPGYNVLEAAVDLGEEPRQIIEDLQSLHCCGRPGMLPDDLVDMEKPTYQHVHIIEDQGMNKPLRLTRVEAAALLLILEQLEQVPGLETPEAITSAAHKLRTIMGLKAQVVFNSTADHDENIDTMVIKLVNQAMEERKQITFRYASVRSDSVSTRHVEPLLIYSYEGQLYLWAWENQAENYRSFRVDRIDQVHKTELAVDPLHTKATFDPDDPFGFSHITLWADVVIQPEATWMAHYWPIKLGKRRSDGQYEAQMPVGKKEWFYRFLLGNADRVSIIGPETLLADFAQRRAEALACYEDNPSNTAKG
ncbi:WYL domain-containing protein [Corynebacterium poyangense]|uniref:WYL domain-containing protein n=1 Tax=Corynebacterium poyangense TaxID=2684405 RepID=A0A7H0SNU3_9CORY|nr:WYL domain-containing protein [Corynebacterium poyangense]MBZ8177772.1 WYL domain-containing protein [Corynebacterium poyangense]QNQ90218.1 WYL domain-containing protein [Corynebacterium poyangense]